MIIALYWEERKESIDDCVKRVMLTFEVISASSPFLTDWYEKGMRSHSSFIRVDVEAVDRMRVLLSDGVSLNDVDDKPIEELGFRISLWNGRTGSVGSSISIQCGSYSKIKGIGNSVVLKIDCGIYQDKHFSEEEMFNKLLDIWCPEKAKIFDFEEVNGDLKEIVYLSYS